MFSFRHFFALFAPLSPSPTYLSPFSCMYLGGLFAPTTIHVSDRIHVSDQYMSLIGYTRILTAKYIRILYIWGDTALHKVYPRFGGYRTHPCVAVYDAIHRSRIASRPLRNYAAIQRYTAPYTIQLYIAYSIQPMQHPSAGTHSV